MTKNPGGSGTPGVTREFIGMDSPTARRAGSGGHPCQGIYYRGVGRKPKVAMIATHYQIDFSEHYLADYMATRGIGFLGWNTRFRGYESSFLLDHALVDVGVGIGTSFPFGVPDVGRAARDMAAHRFGPGVPAAVVLPAEVGGCGMAEVPFGGVACKAAPEHWMRPREAAGRL